LASVAYTGPEAARVLSEVSGRKIEYQQIPLDYLRVQNADHAKMFEWMGRAGCGRYRGIASGVPRGWLAAVSGVGGLAGSDHFPALRGTPREGGRVGPGELTRRRSRSGSSERSPYMLALRGPSELR